MPPTEDNGLGGDGVLKTYKELFTNGREYQQRRIFHAPDDDHNAFHLTPLDQVK